VRALQKVGIGLVIVVLQARFGPWDALADPVGWGFVLAGLLALRTRVRGADTLLASCGVALVVAVGVYPPVVHDALSPAAAWALSLPQAVFCLLVCHTLAPYAGHLRRRLLLLRWVFAVVAVLPVLVLGGGVTRLADPAAGLAGLAALYLVYLLFRLAGRVPLDDRAPLDDHPEPAGETGSETGGEA